MMTFIALLAATTSTHAPIMVRNIVPAQWFSPNVVDVAPA
jgi:hypothetical protein